jgi:hypothetical protein
MELEIVKLGTSKLNSSTKAAQWQAVNDVGTEPGDSEDFGDVDVIQCLGVTSLPWPADDLGFAEGVIVRNCGNRNAIALGARDIRVAGAIGNSKPGDTIVHSTGPNQAAQLQLKEEKRQVVLYTKDSEGVGMVAVLDGKNDQIQIAAFGMIFEMSKANGIKIDNGEGAAIILQGQDIFLNGNVHHPGIPPGMSLMCGPPTGSPGGPASVPMVPAQSFGA